ncbi:MAG: PatB family C-S lyase [Gammaproteobacteria bacterium]|nr:PatB family C-S lyase [Gammaproteobacteria bacterium]MCZ6853825.1 PatB family C-S lyase [Gammaproteobacteria bacterium]
MTDVEQTAFDTEIDRRGTFATKWEKYRGNDVLPFWVADMDFAAPDFILEAVQARLQHGILGYTETPHDLVTAFQNWLQRRHGWSVPEEWLVWLPGVVPGLNLTAKSVASPGGSILIPTPVYHPFLHVAGHVGQASIKVQLARSDVRWEMDFDALADACDRNTRLFLLSNPQNPTGRVYSLAELTTLADFCLEHDLYLCSDEIHCDLVLDENVRHIPIASLAPEIADRTISLFAANKTYNIPGLGCAVAVIPNAKLRANFLSARAGLVHGIGPLAFAACTAAFADTSQWVPTLLEYLRGNLERLQSQIGKRMMPVEATFLAWIDLSNLGIDHPGSYLESYGLGLSDGVPFGGPGFVRFNFGCPRTLLDRGLQRFETALSSQQEPRP